MDQQPDNLSSYQTDTGSPSHHHHDDDGRSTRTGIDRRLRRKRRRRRRRIRAIGVLPSLFTIGNLIAGFAAIHFASKPGLAADTGLFAGVSSLTAAGILIFVGMFFDAVDGFVARLTRTTSDMGAQLDSLADIVTFGVAPAYLTLRLVSSYYQGGTPETTIISPAHDDEFARIFWAVAAIYVACSALRLARFSAESSGHGIEDHMFFRGLPSPGAAGCLTSLIILHQHYIEQLQAVWLARVTGLGMAFIMLLCAIAMVSRLPYVHVANRYVRGNAQFGYVVRLTVLCVASIFYLEEALAIGLTAYALSAPSRYLMRAWSRQGRAAARRVATQASAGAASAETKPSAPAEAK